MALPRGQDFIPLRVPDSFPLWLQVKGRSHPALLLELRPARILIHTSNFHTSLSLLPTLPPSHPALPTAYQLPRPFSSCSLSHSPAARSGVQPLHLEEQIPHTLINTISHTLFHTYSLTSALLLSLCLMHTHICNCRSQTFINRGPHTLPHLPIYFVAISRYSPWTVRLGLSFL